MKKYIRVMFTENTDVGFIDPDTRRKMWYQCWYGRGTHIDVDEILSGNTQEILVLCMDGEIAILQSKAVKILPGRV